MTSISSLSINPLFIVGASFVLTASLAWNDAIQATINHYYKFSRLGIEAKLAYAVCVTIIVVAIMYVLNYIYLTAQKDSGTAAATTPACSAPQDVPSYFDAF